MSNIEIVLKELDRLFPNPLIELNYTKDYELLIAVMLIVKQQIKELI